MALIRLLFAYYLYITTIHDILFNKYIKNMDLNKKT